VGLHSCNVSLGLEKPQRYGRIPLNNMLGNSYEMGCGFDPRYPGIDFVIDDLHLYAEVSTVQPTISVRARKAIPGRVNL